MILSICNVPEVLKVLKLVKTLILIIRIVVPIMLIISIMIDLFKNVVTADELSKTGSIVVKKIFAAVLVFLVPTFVGMIFNIIGAKTSYKSCFEMATTSNYSEKYDQHMLVLMKNVRKDPSLATYGAANEYLSNIKDEVLKNKYKSELDTIKKQLDDNSKENIHYSPGNGGVGSGGSTGSGSGSSSSQGASNASFLAKAKEIWREILFGNRHFSYAHGAHIPPKGSTIDCSSYVDWVLCEYGYKDFCGRQKNSRVFYNTDWNKKYGWTEIKFKAGTNILKMLKPGDIVVRRGADKGHVLIVSKVLKGKIQAYDCGSTWYFKHGGKGPTKDRIKGNYTNGGYRDKFITNDYRPGKIIRVSPLNK